jgi:hypothetical protein
MGPEESADMRGIVVFSVLWNNRVEFSPFHDLRNFRESMYQQ